MEWDELIRIWIIVCPLVFLGGLIDAVAGGGGLITLPAYLLAGLPPHLASGTNKCGNFFGTLIATGRFLKRGDVHLPSALAGGAGALVGAWLGARLNMIMPEQALYYLLKVTHPNPWNREPALRDWLWAEDDLGNFYPSYRQGRLLIEQGYSTMDFGESSGNPSASYPFASYYDLWVSGIDPSATEITLRFDRWGENVLWLTVPLEGGEADG